MTNPIIKLVNAETGEEVERPMTNAELRDYEAFIADLSAEKIKEEAKATAKAALLDRLGITAEEAALLLG